MTHSQVVASTTTTPDAVDPAILARRAEAAAATEATRQRFPHELNVAYGRHPRQVVDLYRSNSTALSAPVLVWLHGGGFSRGAPASDGYNGVPYLERGAVFAAMGYRLTPDGVRFPETCEDIELGLRWLRQNVAERGGDPDRIYLSGHSAGAIVAAAVGFRDELIKGLVLVSGMYDLSHHSDGMVNRASLRWVARQADAFQRVPAHTILIAGERDFPACLPDARALQSAIQSRGGSAELFVEPDADHFHANHGLSTPGTAISNAVAAMLGLD